MDPERNLIVLLAGVALAVPWIVAAALRRIDRGTAVAGLRNGLIAAALLAMGAAGATLLLIAGQPGAVGSAITFGLTVSAAFLWLGLTIMPIGFMARAGADWARYGTWAAVLIIAVSVGLGWTTYTAFESSRPDPAASPAPTQSDPLT